MKGIRQRISLLKNKISENLPDDNDILGYAGISKKIILESISESYDLLSVLEEHKDKFETIFAKRSVSLLIDNSNQFLNEELGRKHAADKFNGFLYQIANIRFHLKEAYLSLSNNPLRIESELVLAKENLIELTTDLDEIKSIKSEIDLIKTESSTFVDELETKHTLAIENEKKINEFVANIEEIDEGLTGTNEKISVWKSELQAIKEDIIKKQTEFTKLKAEIEQTQDTNIVNQTNINKFTKTLSDQFDLNSEHQSYIKKTIEDVSRAGMAGSFKKRKDELKWIQLAWAISTVASIAGLLWISYSIVEPIIANQDFNINHILFKLPVFASAVWLGWFCAKQYGFTSRIMEDYSFKYAISMAFEGYKQETMNLDEDLLKKLIELTILNISKSPVSNFDSKSNHGTPYNEMFESLAKKFVSSNE